MDVGKDSPKLDDILVAQEFPDVYSEKLPGVPPEWEIEFEINLIPGAEPISKAPYLIAPPAELKELKEQLQVVRYEVHSAECITMGSSNIVCIYIYIMGMGRV